MYPVILIDAIVVKIRDGQVANRPIYVAMASTESPADCDTVMTSAEGRVVQPARSMTHSLSVSVGLAVAAITIPSAEALPQRLAVASPADVSA